MAAAAEAALACVLGPSGRRQYLGSDDQNRNVFVVIFGCDRHTVNRRANGPWELVARIPAVRCRAGGVTETYYERIVHQVHLCGVL